MKTIFSIISLAILVSSALYDPSTDLTAQIDQLIQSRNLKGIQI